jgi:hypothetical protein
MSLVAEMLLQILAEVESCMIGRDMDAHGASLGAESDVQTLRRSPCELDRQFLT